MDNLKDFFVDRWKYFVIIATYFILMFTPILAYPLAKSLVFVIDTLNINITNEQLNGTFQFIFFMMLTVTFVVLIFKDLKEDLFKTGRESITFDESRPGFNFFLQMLFTYIAYMLIAIIVGIIISMLSVTLESSQNQEAIESITTGGDIIPISMILTIVFLGPLLRN